jgi:16S rRNA (cytosine967-C5)-methyltransferase
MEGAQVKMTAVDIDRERLMKVNDNLGRLKLISAGDANAVLRVADAASAGWWDGQAFDKILIDAPCSASGIVSRHPDIPFLRRANDVPDLQKRQRALLHQAWQMLKEGGLLLYVTCSVFPEEGEEQAAWFIANQENAVRLNAPGQILPSSTHDGFYYALFTKNGP